MGVFIADTTLRRVDDFDGSEFEVLDSGESLLQMKS